MTPSAEPRHISIAEIVARHGEPPWAEALFTDGRNNAVLICDAPGQQNDAHAHPDFNEWWIVLQGELLWEIGDYAPLRAKKGDVVMAPKGRRHAIRTVGSENSLRLGVTHPESNHDDKGTRSNILRPLPQDDIPNRLHAPAWTICWKISASRPGRPQYSPTTATAPTSSATPRE